jgi:hypothetical protein
MASRLKRHENPASRQDLLDLAELEARATREIINGTIEVPLLSVGLNEAQLRAVVDDSLILASPSRDWWSRQAAALRQRSTNEMRQGIFLGERVDTLTRRIRGSQVAGFANGVMNVSRREGAALVRHQ